MANFGFFYFNTMFDLVLFPLFRLASFSKVHNFYAIVFYRHSGWAFRIRLSIRFIATSSNCFNRFLLTLFLNDWCISFGVPARL